ncbi:hypothetical protein [Streptomyces sp. NPDC007988]|uniref:hypothetical protein n=1 Tax=Streptomyces sp. NPDC007988 TaxID=3364802 RepID=UPI0036EE6794
MEEIVEFELRASAQKLIDTFYERTSQAQANADAFGVNVPDQQNLFDRLRLSVPCDGVRRVALLTRPPGRPASEPGSQRR